MWAEVFLNLNFQLGDPGSMSIDCNIKRARFIGKVNSLFQEFYFSTPDVKSKLMSVYCTSFYGSCLYNLYNRDCDKLYKSYNVATRIGYSLPRETHTTQPGKNGHAICRKISAKTSYVQFTQANL